MANPDPMVAVKSRIPYPVSRQDILCFLEAHAVFGEIPGLTNTLPDRLIFTNVKDYRHSHVVVVKT